MKGRMKHLEESTDTVKSNNNLPTIMIILTYFGIWIISLVSFCLFGTGDALGHTLIFLYIVLPVTTLILSFIIGKNNYWGKWKWLSSIAFGVMYMLADYTTFGASNMIVFEKLNIPQFGMIPAGAIISLVGMCAGFGIYWLNSRKK